MILWKLISIFQFKIPLLKLLLRMNGLLCWEFKERKMGMYILVYMKRIIQMKLMISSQANFLYYNL